MGGDKTKSPVLTSDPPPPPSDSRSERHNDVLQLVYGKTAAGDAAPFPKTSSVSGVTLERNFKETESVFVCVC